MYANFLNNVKGGFFFSTPHLGFYSQLVDHDLSLAGEKRELMQSLEVFNKCTSRLNYDFTRILKRDGWKTCGVGASNNTQIHLFKDTVRGAIMEILVAEVQLEQDVRTGSLS